MTNAIQALLLVAAVALAVFFLLNRRKARAKAWVKILFGFFIIVIFWCVLRPDDLTVVANFLGVSRGTDLLLYALAIAFMFTTVSTWIRFRENELRYARLARAVALQNALRPGEEPRVPGAPHPELGNGRGESVTDTGSSA